MKKLLLLTLIFSLLFTAVGCEPLFDKGAEEGLFGSCYVVIATDPVKEYKVDLTKITPGEGLISVLKYLRDTEGLTFTETSGAYGAYLTAVDGLVAGDTAYIALYTSVTADADVSAYADPISSKESTLTTAGVGASSLRIEEDAVYYIALVSY